MVPLVHRLQENLPSFSFKLFLRKYGWCAYSSLDELFRFKDPVPQILTSGVVYKSQCGLCNEFYYGECVRYFAVRSGDHIGISPLTNKRVRSRKDSATCHHLLNYNDSPIFADFNDLCNENKKYFLKLKESLLIMSKRPTMNQNVLSAPLYLFEWVLVTVFAAPCGLLWSVFYLFYVSC